MATISNGESGSSVRTKLNEIINKVEGATSINNNIDVTGTVTADGLTVDGNVAVGSTGASDRQIYMGSVGNLYGALDTDGASGNFNITSGHATTGGTALQFYTANSGSEIRRTRIDTNGNIIFYDTAGSSQSFFWDAAAESLGIGTTSPASLIHANNTSGDATIRITSSDTGYAQLFLGDQTSGSQGRLEYYNNNNSMGFYTAGTEAMRIDSSGNVLINTASHTPTDTELVVSSEYSASGTTDAGITLSSRQGGNWRNSGIFANGDALTFTTGDTGLNGAVSTSEKMRIDSSGTLLVNRTSAFTTAKTEIQSDAGDPLTLALNTIDTDGSILSFYKAGTTVGSIGSSSIGGLEITGNNSGRSLLLTTNFFPANGSGAKNDGVIDLGISDARWKDLYLSGGVYLGGTGSANHLDDYETGTWTPTLRFGGATTGITYGNQYATYTKIGNRVTVDFNIRLSSKGSATGNATIAGLSFNAKNDEGGTAEPYSSGVLTLESNGSSFPQKTTYIMPWSDGAVHLRANGSTALEYITNSNFTDTTEIYGTVTYRVA